MTKPKHRLQRGVAGTGVAPCPLVAGVVCSPESLRAALALAPAPAAPDALELRVDHFAETPALPRPLVEAAARPLIVTVRDQREGGAADLSAARRCALYEEFLPAATWIDLELRSLAQPVFARLAERARQHGCRLIGSFHDFEKTPSLSRLRELAARARALGANIFKVATLLRGPGDLARLLELLDRESARIPLAAMGMGEPLGRVSRLALATAGSALNYGYLGPAAPLAGQWPAALLRERLEELRPPPRRRSPEIPGPAD